MQAAEEDKQAFIKMERDIMHRNITPKTYELARQICTRIDPNQGVCMRNIMFILCDGIYSMELEFAKFWLSLKFAVPIDLSVEDYNGKTCISHALYYNNGGDMFKIIFDSEPGKRFIQEHNMCSIAFNPFWISEVALEVLMCHIPNEHITECHLKANFGRYLLHEFVSNPAKCLTRLRIKHGYGYLESSRLLALVLLLENKILTIR